MPPADLKRGEDYAAYRARKFAERAKAADISELELLRAVRAFHAKRQGPPDEELRFPPKVVEAKMRKLERRGLLEVGVSLRTAWLSPAGEAYLAELEVNDPPQPRFRLYSIEPAEKPGECRRVPRGVVLGSSAEDAVRAAAYGLALVGVRAALEAYPEDGEQPPETFRPSWAGTVARAFDVPLKMITDENETS